VIRTSSPPDVAIAGAGLIGLAIAFELAQRGAVVRVYDRSEPARAASWAGAGMLAPYTESARDEALLELCAASLREYPSFVERVREASGVDSHLHLDGIVHAGFGAEQRAGLVRRADWLRARGIACELLDRTQAIALEPWLGSHTSGALLVGCEGHVDNRRLGRALVAACRERGVVIETVASVKVECDARRVLGMRTDFGFTPAGAVINAAGAWAGRLQGLPAAVLPAVEPRKGQMLALQVPAGFVRRATWLPGAYVVPRDDGRLLVGATDERAGFDERVTAAGLRTILDAVLDAAPALAGFSVVETWAGLRPGTPDGRPYIGATPLAGLYLAAGHYRNGILLAPATARLVCEAVMGTADAQLEAFSLGRATASAPNVESAMHSAKATAI
jgi:glycine oxidase